MSPRMRPMFHGFFLAAFILMLVLPIFAPAYAAIVPCARNEGTAAETAPCTLCHLIVGIWNVIDWLRKIIVAICITVIVAMGILYIVSTGNDSLMSFAKGGLMASLMGFAVVLGAWLIVNIVLTLPIFSSTGLIKTDWYTFTCDTTSAVRP